MSHRKRVLSYVGMVLGLAAVTGVLPAFVLYLAGVSIVPAVIIGLFGTAFVFGVLDIAHDHWRWMGNVGADDGLSSERVLRLYVAGSVTLLVVYAAALAMKPKGTFTIGHYDAFEAAMDVAGVGSILLLLLVVAPWLARIRRGSPGRGGSTLVSMGLVANILTAFGYWLLGPPMLAP